MTVTVLQRKASMQLIGLLLVPAIKGAVYRVRKNKVDP